MPKEYILAVDDEEDILELVTFNLAREGYRVSSATTGEEALKTARNELPDIIVLDLMLPGIDGLQVTKVLKNDRQTKDIPIIMLTAKGEEADIVTGLELGADDYITKPFSPRVLVARVKAVLRRLTRSEGYEPKTLTHGPLRLDQDRYKSYWDDTEVVLTVTEFRVLQALLSYPGKVYSRDELMDRAYPDGAIVSDRTIDSHVKRIRKKFEAAGGNPIVTVHGIGYRIEEY